MSTTEKNTSNTFGKTETLKIKMTFTTPLLGMGVADQTVFDNIFAAKAPTQAKADEEASSIVKPVVADEDEPRQITVFPKDEKGLHLWDYQLKGFFKEAVACLIDLGELELSKYAHKKAVDQFVHITPRKIYLHDLSGRIWQTAPRLNTRPLRGSVNGIERISIARSQELPEGTSIEFTVTLQSFLKKEKKSVAVIDSDVAKKCFILKGPQGFGQWRNGGYGRFDWVEMA